jgi:hypothetical protein
VAPLPETRPVFFSSLLPKLPFVISQKREICEDFNENCNPSFLRNIRKTLRFDHKMKTKLNHKKFTCPLNLCFLLGVRFRGQLNFLWLNLVFILLSKCGFCWCFAKNDGVHFPLMSSQIWCFWSQMAVLEKS